MSKKGEKVQGQEVAQGTDIDGGTPPAMPAVERLDAIADELAANDAAIADAAAGETLSKEAAEQLKAAELAAATAAATMGVNALVALFTAQVPYVHIDDKAREAVIEKAAPVLVKHGVGGELPPWLVKWREEIELGMVVGGIGFSVYIQVQQHKKAEAEAERQRQQAKQQNGQQQPGRVDLSTGQQVAA